MKIIIKFLLYALIILLLVSWISTVVKSCNKDKSAVTTEEKQEDQGYRDAVEMMEEDEKSLSDFIDDTVEESEEKRESKESTEVREPASTTPETRNQTQDTGDRTPTTGNYFLIAGSFGVKSNANDQVKRIKGKGFNNAEAVQFDGSSLYSVIAGRYADLEKANDAMAKLKAKGVDCYVKKREE